MRRSLILVFAIMPLFLPLTQPLAAPAPVAVSLPSGTEIAHEFFRYTDHTVLIRSVKLLEKFGFNTATVAETLNFNTWPGGTVVFWPASGAKPLNIADALAALHNTLQPVTQTATDSVNIRNTLVSQDENSAIIMQSYQVKKDGTAVSGDTNINIPADGLALTIIKIGDSQLLAILSCKPQPIK
ncbi:hypothetical protein JRY02_05115 [Enterobacter roggenkampii]|nr:hypothetical protein [Enterobacter roggenkampii]